MASGKETGRRRRSHREPERGLQPLRIGIGWTVAHNGFYELDPPRDWERDSASLFFTEDMLLLQNQQRRVLIDLSWMPYGPKGRFVLYATDWVGAPEMPYEWERPLLQVRTRSRERIVKTLDRWLDEHFDWSAAKQHHRQKSRRKMNVTTLQKLYESQQ